MLTVYYLVLQLKKTQRLFSLQQMAKWYKRLYISENENWDKIKNESYSTNVVLTDSTNPIAAKHFAFEYETKDWHNLLNFEYSLLNDQGKLLEFKQGEDKIHALNFTIQVI